MENNILVVVGFDVIKADNTRVISGIIECARHLRSFVYVFYIVGCVRRLQYILKHKETYYPQS